MADTFIRLDSVGLEYPVYSLRAQSLRYAAINMAVGGRLFKGKADRVVVRALDGINLSLSSGDRLALIGPNGAGKSSLLKVLAGVYQPTRGKIDVGGRVASMLDIGHGLDMEASGIQNIRLLSCMRGYSPWRLKDKVDEIVEFSGLGAFINMPVRTYSAGMLARLLFSVATAFDYDVLLLEEWLSAGDASFVRKATQRMADFISHSRVIVTATHSIDLVKTLCNKVLRLEHGSPTFFGTVEEYLIAFPPN